MSRTQKTPRRGAGTQLPWPAFVGRGVGLIEGRPDQGAMLRRQPAGQVRTACVLPTQPPALKVTKFRGHAGKRMQKTPGRLIGALEPAPLVVGRLVGRLVGLLVGVPERLEVGGLARRNPEGHTTTPTLAWQPLPRTVKLRGQTLLERGGAQTTPCVLLALRTRRQGRGHVRVLVLGARQPPVTRFQPVGQMMALRRAHATPETLVAPPMMDHKLVGVGHVFVAGLLALQPPPHGVHPLGQKVEMRGWHVTPLVCVAAVTRLHVLGHLLVPRGARQPPCTLRQADVGQRMRSAVPQVTPTLVVAGATTTKPLGQVVVLGLGAWQPFLTLRQPEGHVKEKLLRTQKTPRAGELGEAVTILLWVGDDVGLSEKNPVGLNVAVVVGLKVGLAVGPCVATLHPFGHVRTAGVAPRQPPRAMTKFRGQIIEGLHRTPKLALARETRSQNGGHVVVVEEGARQPELLILRQPVGQRNLDWREHVTPCVRVADLVRTNPVGQVFVATRLALQPPFTRVQPTGQPCDDETRTQKTPGGPGGTQLPWPFNVGRGVGLAVGLTPPGRTARRQPRGQDVVVALRARQPPGTGLKPVGQRPAGVHVTPVVDVAETTRFQFRGQTVVRRLMERQFLVVPMRLHWLLGQMIVGRQETPRVAVGAAICRQPGRHVLTPLEARQPPGMDAHLLGHAMRRMGAQTNPWVPLGSLTLFQPVGHLVTAGCLLGAMHPPAVRVHVAGHNMT